MHSIVGELKAENQQQDEKIVALQQQINAEKKTAVVAAIGIPKSCADLRNNGHSANGLYLFMGTDKVETVHCDFSLLPNNSSNSNFTSIVKILKLIKSNK